MKKKISLLLLSVVIFVNVFAQPGKLDSSFGNNGVLIKQSFEVLYGFIDMSVLKNDNILVCSWYYRASEFNRGIIVLDRHLPNGAVDSSFGNNGTIELPSKLQPKSIAVQKDGRIVITGDYDLYRLGILRFIADGQIDSSFATNGLYLDTELYRHYATDIVVQPDGKIIVSGCYEFDRDRGVFYPTLTRINEDGTIDDSFGEKGTGIYKDSKSIGYVNNIALLKDGRIICGGDNNAGVDPSSMFFLACYKTNGDIDSSFGVNGEVITDLGKDGEYIDDLAIQEDGKIVAAGTAQRFGFPPRKPYIAVVRYNTDGSFDENFGKAGRSNIVFDNISQSSSVVLQKDGKIIVSGFTTIITTDFAVVRLLNNGTLDSTFGNGGKVITDIRKNYDEAYTVGLQSTGNIIVGGAEIFSNGTDASVVLARYLGDPTKTRPTIAQIKRWIRNHILHFEDANTNAAYYVIEKSTVTNGVFVPVTKIAVNAATYNYSYTLPEAASQSTYRIKAVNKDNSITYSSPISSSDPAKAGVASFKVYPNPAKDRIAVETSGTVQLRLQNSNGRVLLTQTVTGKGIIDISKLPVGVYYVVNTINGESLKVVKE